MQKCSPRLAIHFCLFLGWSRPVKWAGSTLDLVDEFGQCRAIISRCFAGQWPRELPVNYSFSSQLWLFPLTTSGWGTILTKNLDSDIKWIRRQNRSAATGVDNVFSGFGAENFLYYHPGSLSTSSSILLLCFTGSKVECHCGIFEFREKHPKICHLASMART